MPDKQQVIVAVRGTIIIIRICIIVVLSILLKINPPWQIFLRAEFQLRDVERMMETQKSPKGKHHIIVAAKNHWWMLKLGGKSVMRNRIICIISKYLSTRCSLQRENRQLYSWRNVADTTLTKRSKLTSQETRRHQNHVPLDRMDWGEHVTPVVYLLKTHNPNLIMRKHQRTQLKDSVQNNWQIRFKSVKVIKDKNWGTIIEWRRWNATEDPGLDPEPEKEQQKKPKTPGKIQIRSAD